MKKRSVISITLAAILAVSAPALIACSGDHYGSIDFPAQDTSMIVTSQGGSTVAYGNYVYFINGTRGYDDADGKANVWNEVVKGGLYRAELNGTTEKNGGVTSFVPAMDDKCLEFKYTAKTDYFDAPIDEVNVTKIAPKTIGTTGYAQGGIFIYDNYVFFASPNNEKNSTGTVQTTRTDFFMMPLNGGAPTKIYTTAEKVDTTAAAYAFYKLNGAVYLVVNESGTIATVRADLSKAKADDPVKYKVNATSVYFPVRDTYYKGIANNTVEDFIYFVRAVNDDDPIRSGTVIEAMRPNGKEQFVVSMTDKTQTVEAVRDGIVFYRTANGQGETIIAYTNLHDQRYEMSKTYRAEQDKLDAHDRQTQISGQFPTPVASGVTATYAFRADTGSDTVYYAAVTDSAINLYCNNMGAPLVGKIAESTGTPLFIKENYLYVSGSNADFSRVPLFDNMDGYGAAENVAEKTTSAGISCDYALGYFTYFAEVDQWADAYTYFYKVDGPEGVEPVFVGKRGAADIPTKEQIKEAKGETDED